MTRSILFVPGDSPRKFERAAAGDADALVLDLEDSVAPDAKAAAREVIVSALRAGGYGRRELVIRVNALSTSWGQADLVAVARSRAHAVLLPKVESADAVRQAEATLVAAGAPPDLAIWCMIETPRGVLKSAEIAEATPRLACLVMGTSDLAKDLHAAHTPDRAPMLTSLGLCVLAARANGLAILDGVHLDLNDDAGFSASCKQGRELGFDGKTLIHPKTIDAANAAFAPAAEEIGFARKIISAHAEAEAAGKGVVVVDGKLIESLHVQNARRLVALDDMIQAMAS